MEIISYNLFRLKDRKENLAAMLQKHRPDILCMQETWHPRNDLSHSMFRIFDTHAHYRSEEKKGEGVGITGYGEDLTHTLPQYLQTYRNAVYMKADDYHIINIHAPWKFYEEEYGYNHKSKWFFELCTWLSSTFDLDEDKVVIIGDFNVNLDESCIEDISEEADEPLIGLRPSEHDMMNSLFDLGFVDAYEHADDHDMDNHKYTWFDLEDVEDPQRIDYALVSAPLIDDIVSCTTLTEYRIRQDSSDHVPLKLVLQDYLRNGEKI